MKQKQGVARIVWDLAEPLCEEFGYILWDVEYVREGADMILRVTIDTDAETGRKDIYLEHGARTLDACTIRRDDGLTKTPYAFKGMTVSQIMTKILSYQSPARWTVGTIAQAVAGQVLYMEPEGMSLTTAILTMMESIPAYQANFVQAAENDWHIDIVARPTTVQAEVRLNRNLKSCDISCNASAICTRVWCEGITGGKMDSANTSLYGVREETMSLNDSLTTAQKEAIVTAYLAAHDHPIISLSISGYELSQITGLDIDSLLLGQLCRVAVPWLGVTESEVIVTKTCDLPGPAKEERIDLGADQAGKRIDFFRVRVQFYRADLYDLKWDLFLLINLICGLVPFQIKYNIIHCPLAF